MIIWLGIGMDLKFKNKLEVIDYLLWFRWFIVMLLVIVFILFYYIKCIWIYLFVYLKCLLLDGVIGFMKCFGYKGIFVYFFIYFFGNF